jgi:hypothetical protein
VSFDVAWRLDQAIGYVVEGKAVDWRETVEAALDHDAQLVDVHLQRAVLRRLQTMNGFDRDELGGLVRLSEAIAVSFTDPEFAVPSFLLEFVIRRALDEDGCCDFLDLREVAFASTQLCAALDARSRLFPPGWKSGVYVRL